MQEGRYVGVSSRQLSVLAPFCEEFLLSHVHPRKNALFRAYSVFSEVLFRQLRTGLRGTIVYQLPSRKYKKIVDL